MSIAVPVPNDPIDAAIQALRAGGFQVHIAAEDREPAPDGVPDAI